LPNGKSRSTHPPRSSRFARKMSPATLPE
jgi:hypothetical protein